MTEKEKQHVKAILIAIRDKHIGVTSNFICPCSQYLNSDNSLVTGFLNRNRPTSRNKFKSFTKHEYWIWGNKFDYSTGKPWWAVAAAYDDGKLELLIEEKKRYLTALIETLN